MRYAYFFEFEGMEIHLGDERLREIVHNNACK